jgi:hypothetical protein
MAASITSRILSANRHVMWREPTAHPFNLQTGMDAVSEVLILSRVAYEAGMILDDPIEERSRSTLFYLSRGESRSATIPDRRRVRWSMLLGL